MENKGYKQIESVKKSMEILEILSKASRPVSPGELAGQTGMPQATVMGHITTLLSGGYVAEFGGNYTLGMATAMLWSRYKEYLEGQRRDINRRLVLIRAEEAAADDGYSESGYRRVG